MSATRPTVTEQRDALLKELRKLEWTGTVQGQGFGPMGSGGDGARYAACPSCGGLRKPSNEFNDQQPVGHTKRCTLAKALTIASGR